MLDKVRSFLPQLADANKKLEQEFATDETAKERYNIECLNDEAEQVIQMELHCGVLEEKKSTTTDDIKLPNGIPNPDSNNNEEKQDDNNDDDEEEKKTEIVEIKKL